MPLALKNRDFLQFLAQKKRLDSGAIRAVSGAMYKRRRIQARLDTKVLI
jgi:hypothetical protein